MLLAHGLQVLSPLHCLPPYNCLPYHYIPWNPRVRQMLTTSPNPEDKLLVTVKLLEQTVGHVTREQSRIVYKVKGIQYLLEKA